MITEKNTVPSGQIIFKCTCENTRVGTNDDTLMAEYTTSELKSYKHSTFLENASHDNAGNKVQKECPKCSLDYLTMSRLGPDSQIIYTCDCGYRASHDEWSTYYKQF